MRDYDMPTPLEEKAEQVIYSVRDKANISVSQVKSLGFWAINILLVIVVCFLSFATADYELTETLKDISLNAILISICAIVAYLNSGFYGMNAGRKSKEYISAIQRYNCLKEKITSAGIRDRLEDYCAKWTAEDLAKARESVLGDCGISYAEYVNKGYAKLGVWEIMKLRLGKHATRTIILANRIKPLKLNATMLLAPNQSLKRQKTALGKNPVVADGIHDAGKIVSTIVNLFITCGVALSATTEITVATIAVFLLKVALVCYNIVSGYSRKFSKVAINVSAYTDQQSDYLEDFITSQNYVSNEPAA